MESDIPPEPAAAAPDAAPAETKSEGWWPTLRFFLLLFVAALVIRTFLFAPFSIPTASMLPNLMAGDHLFVAKWPYGYSRYAFPFGLASFEGRLLGGLPERGDIVVFHYPGGGDQDYVKRVIGLPGDRIEVRDGIVILNRRPLPRQRIADFSMPVSPNSRCEVQEGVMRRIVRQSGAEYCAFPRFRETLPDGRSYEVLDQVDGSGADDFPALVVPEGHLFVMGDNRDDSYDSRFAVAAGGVGLLPVDNVIGRAAIAFWSTDGSAEWLKPWTWFSAARWGRIGQTW